jgi:hypothetical protein
MGFESVSDSPEAGYARNGEGIEGPSDGRFAVRGVSLVRCSGSFWAVTVILSAVFRPPQTRLLLGRHCSGITRNPNVVARSVIAYWE